MSPRPRLDVDSLVQTPVSLEDETRAKGRGFKKARSRELDAVPIVNINFRLERSRAAKLKAHCVGEGITQEEFFDALLRQAGY